MPRYEHLRLTRLPEQLERRKRPGFGGSPSRNTGAHSAKLQRELHEAIASQVARRPAAYVDPSLILTVRMSGGLLEEEWARLGVKVLSSDSDRTLVLLAGDNESRELQQRFAAYAAGPQGGQKHAPYNGFVGGIDSIGTVQPRDRIGRALREQGLVEQDDFLDDIEYVLDVELWDIGPRSMRERKLDVISAMMAESGGEELDRYVGPSISMLRVRGPGAAIRLLLSVPETATVDLSPRADTDTADIVEMALADLPPVESDLDTAAVIGILDSGINEHPLLAGLTVGAIGVPGILGTDDVWGHGTSVSGAAVFGDLRQQLANRSLRAEARVCVAKVTNDAGNFDDRRLVPSVMREAIQRLNENFGCRIFVSALADSRSAYTGDKVGTWAATLDELARELDVLIVVAAGNRMPRSGGRVEEGVTEYPDYLLEEQNRLFEPAGALNVLTVGSLSHGEGIDAQLAPHAHVRPITRRFQPSPFTRIGPGAGGATKPELVDIGGTLVYDAATMQLRDGKSLASAGMITLHHRFLERLLTAKSGTSFAAPLVAHKAAQLLRQVPNASANLLRALLVGSAQVPREAQECLVLSGDQARERICGHGLADLDRAGYSDDSRVVLYAEDVLPADHFAIYQIPIPLEFQTEPGRRTVTVTLAYDPPVRHTRNDYAGLGMNFRLVRGITADRIFEHFRRRTRDEGPIPEIEARYNCSLSPGPQQREKGTVQRASIAFSRNIEAYGSDYYLVIRCEAGWSTEISQSFAVVVELSHEAEIRLYQRLRPRVRV